MKNWSRERWRRLYLRESVEQRGLWPLMQRGVRDYCIKVAEDDGTLVRLREGDDAVEALARALGAHPVELTLAKVAISGLLDDGFLEARDGRVFVVNLSAAQGDREPDSSPTAAPSGPLSAAERARNYRLNKKQRDGKRDDSSQRSVSERHETSRDAAVGHVVTASRGERENEASESLLDNPTNQNIQPDQSASASARDEARDGHRDAADEVSVTKLVTAGPVTRPDPFSSSFNQHPEDVRVLELWAVRFQKKDVVRDTRRLYMIELRRLEGMTEQDAKDAMEGAWDDEWCRSKHVQVELIFGERSRFERYRDAGRALREGKAQPSKPRIRGIIPPKVANSGNYSAVEHARRKP